MSDYLDHLDRGVLIDIFARLPVETLARLTFVCKSWRSFITSPEFIYHPLIRNAANDRRLLLVGCRTYVPKEDQFCPTDHYSLMVDGNDSFRQLKAIHLPFDSVGLSIVGSVNGVICLADDFSCGFSDDMFLWNPSIRKCVALPKYDVKFNSHGPISPFLGFGFDPVTNDFKVVRIGRLNSRCYSIPPFIELYTHKTRRWWNISEKAIPSMFVECGQQAYVNGASNWMMTGLGTSRKTILSFNMSAEVFNEILIPESVAYEDHLNLVVFKESLCLMQEDVNHMVPHLAVCIMKEYSVSTSWSRLFKIDLPGVALALRENGEVIFATDHDGKLVSCDHQSGHMTDLGIGDTFGSGWHRFYMEPYIGSLELLN